MSTIIALCGYPKAGKSTVQTILEDHYQYQPLDDAAPFRRAAEALFGLNHAQTHTQEGKASTYMLAGKHYTIRSLIGAMGDTAHALFGDEFKVARLAPFLHHDQRYCIASCRGSEAKHWKARGATIIAITRPGITPPDDPRDRYNPDYIDHTLDNHGTIDDLVAHTHALMQRLHPAGA